MTNCKLCIKSKKYELCIKPKKHSDKYDKIAFVINMFAVKKVVNIFKKILYLMQEIYK